MHLNETGLKKPFYSEDKSKSKEEVGSNKKNASKKVDTFDLDDEANYIPTSAEYEKQKRREKEENN